MEASMKLSLPLSIGAASGIVGATSAVVHERRLRQAMERFAGASLETLLNAIEANDPETGMHVRRVASVALIIADAASFDQHTHHAIERVALFHDIGKIHQALFDIVHESRKLSPAERRAIATHPARGAQVLAPFTAFYPELPAGVIAHHERWDGSGYPRGLRGRRIPLEARVVAIADTFDAVAHSRRYRRGTGAREAMNVVAQGRGTQFDPELVDLALFPPVRAEIERQRLLPSDRSDRHPGRRTHERESIPDVDFRWRSESLSTERVRRSARDVD
jgi:HD-GYP domain-containing protein (c-di-GMP phosphodiesterase class II)